MNIFDLFKIRDETNKDIASIIRFFYLVAVLSLGAVLWYCGFTRVAATPLLWGLACASVGAAFGFLFGIPKILQSERPQKSDQPSDYRQQVNTNLTEISDWLTKIIVGLGLINLSSIPSKLSSTAEVLAVSLNPAEPGREKAFALALILCFLIIGFLFGYLSTRLFLQAAFSRADQEASILRQTERAIATTQARLTTLETKQEYILSAEPPESNGAPRAEGQAPIQDPMLELKALADNYLAIVAENSSERVRLKNQAASAMLSLIRNYRIPKDLIFREADQTGNEGLILALANYIINYPDKDDLNYLLPLADRVNRLHVKYRVVQALGELSAKTYTSATEAAAVERILTSYETGADPDLLSLIKGTRPVLRTAPQLS